MGTAVDFICTNCGYQARQVTENFDYGMSGEVTTPVVCPKHRIRQVSTGLNARNAGWNTDLPIEYPCPTCGRTSPLWNRETCPQCGQTTMEPDPTGSLMMWD